MRLRMLRSLRAQARRCLGGCFSKRLDSFSEKVSAKQGSTSFQALERSTRAPSKAARIHENVPNTKPSLSTPDDEDFSACWQMQPISKICTLSSHAQDSAASFKKATKERLYQTRGSGSECGIVEPLLHCDNVSKNSNAVDESSDVGNTGFKTWEPESLLASQDLSTGRPGSSISAASEENQSKSRANDLNVVTEECSVDDFRQTVFYKDLTQSIELIGENLPGPMGFPAYCQAVFHINRAIHQEGRRLTYDKSRRNIMKKRPEAAHIYANMELEDWDALNTSLPPSAMKVPEQCDDGK